MPNEEVVAESTPAPVVEAPVVKAEAVTPETSATQAQETPADAGNSQEVQAVEPVDETGVPWKNHLSSTRVIR